MSAQSEHPDHDGMETSSIGGPISPNTVAELPMEIESVTPESAPSMDLEPTQGTQIAINQEEPVAVTAEYNPRFTRDELWYDLLGLPRFQFMPDYFSRLETPINKPNLIEMNLEDFSVASVLLCKDGVRVNRTAMVKPISGMNVVKISHCKEAIVNGNPKFDLVQMLTNWVIHGVYWETSECKSTESARKRKAARLKYEKEKREIEKTIEELTSRHMLLLKSHAKTKNEILNITASNLLPLPDVALLSYIHRWNADFDSVCKTLKEANDKLNHLNDEWKAMQVELPEDSVDEYACVAVLTFYALAEGEQRLMLSYSYPDYTWDARYNIHFITHDAQRAYKPYVRFEYIITCKHDIDEVWEHVPVEVSTEECYSRRVAETFTVPKLEITTEQARKTPWDTLRKCIQEEILVLKRPMGVPLTQPIQSAFELKHFDVEQITATFRKNETVMIMAGHFVADCAKEYICLPANSSKVYCMMSFQYPKPYSLIPGEATVFFNSSFSYQTTVRQIRHLDTIECPAGVETCFNVIHYRVRNREATRGLFRGDRTNQTTVNHFMKLQNSNIPSTDKVTAMLPLPTATDNQIRVSVVGDTSSLYLTPPHRIENERGFSAVVMNLLSLEPLMTSSYAIKFVTDYPANLGLRAMHPVPEDVDDVVNAREE